MMENKLREIMSSVLSVNIENINLETTSENVDNWDSLRHMNLIVVLEEEFDIEFEEEEIIELMSYKSICDILKIKL